MTTPRATGVGATGVGATPSACSNAPRIEPFGPFAPFPKQPIKRTWCSLRDVCAPR